MYLIYNSYGLREINIYSFHQNIASENNYISVLTVFFGFDIKTHRSMYYNDITLLIYLTTTKDVLKLLVPILGPT